MYTKRWVEIININPLAFVEWCLFLQEGFVNNIYKKSRYGI